MSTLTIVLHLSKKAAKALVGRRPQYGPFSSPVFCSPCRPVQNMMDSCSKRNPVVLVVWGRRGWLGCADWLSFAVADVLFICSSFVIQILAFYFTLLGISDGGDAWKKQQKKRARKCPQKRWSSLLLHETTLYPALVLFSVLGCHTLLVHCPPTGPVHFSRHFPVYLSWHRECTIHWGLLSRPNQLWGLCATIVWVSVGLQE